MEKVYKEKRGFQVFLRDAEAEGETKKIIYGTPILFNTESIDLGGFKEIIRPSAFTVEDIKRFDIRLNYQHNSTTIIPLARCKFGTGSMTITVDEIGVHFETELKGTATSTEVYEAIRAGDLDSMSFHFGVCKGDHSFKRKADSTEYIHEVTRFEWVKDFSIVNEPAYLETSITSIALDEFKRAESDAALELEKAKAEEQRLAKEEEDKKYWQKYDELLDKYKNLN